jgi:hypothetical protein
LWASFIEFFTTTGERILFLSPKSAERALKEQEERWVATLKNAINLNMSNSEAYQLFVTPPIPQFDCPFKHSIYDPRNCGRLMVSVDIREASFQALRFIDPNLVDQCPTWPDYLSKFPEIPSFMSSCKNFRHLLMGFCEPKKHQSVEKLLIGRIAERLKEKKHKELLFVNLDELIFLCRYDYKPEKDINDAQEAISAVVEEFNCDTRFRVELIRLRHLPPTNKNYYLRQVLDPSTLAVQDWMLKNVPLTHKAQYTKKILGQPFKDEDFLSERNGRVLFENLTEEM